jgi:serine protease AprX
LAVSQPAAATPPRGASDKLDRALLAQQVTRADDLPVIISVRDGAKNGVRRRIEALGQRVTKEHRIVNALSAHLEARMLDIVAGDPDVTNISLDADMAADATTSTTSVVSNVKQTLGLGNWYPGSTVTIAVIDSGIANTADFTGRIVGTYDFTNGRGGIPQVPVDGYGHGTHVAGLAGASGAISSGVYAGVASGVKLLSLRVLDASGAGKTSDVIQALEFAVANKAAFNIRVINLSLGHPIYESARTDPLVQAVETAVRAGIVMVVAAGNCGMNPATGLPGYGGITSPGNAPSAITVGAATNGGTLERTDDRVAVFSSRGPSWLDGYGKPDVVAPGYGLLSDEVDGSSLAVSFPSLVYTSSAGKLIKLSGSSMATGVVSGLVAVMIDANNNAVQQRYNDLSAKDKKLYIAPPPMTPNALKAMLQYSATPLHDATGANYNALTQGTGEVDGYAAMILAASVDTSKAVGTAWLPSLPATTQFGTETDTWAQNIVWGTVDVTGSGLMVVNQSAWAQSVTWGSGELNNIVWGTAADGDQDNIVWGTSALPLPAIAWAGNVLQGTNIVWGTSLGDWAFNIVWGTSIGVLQGTNIVWGTSDGDGDNIVWGTMTDGDGDNIVWGTASFDTAVWGSVTKLLAWIVAGGAA